MGITLVPILVLASSIEPDPIVYQQGGQCYNEKVQLHTTERVTFAVATEAPTSSEEGVFVAEPAGPPECYCITYLRERLGVNIRGDAHTIKPNIDHPILGGVILIDYGDIAHAGKITYVLGDRIIFEDSNFIKCTPRKKVMIMKDDPRIRVYYFKNPN